MRKALIVGIDYYDRIGSLSGCVNDAHAVNAVLERHADGRLNFPTPQLVVGTGATQSVSRQDLKDLVRELFAGDAEIALFFFAGHGHVEDTGGFLCASDCTSGDDGLSLAEVMTLANRSKATNKVIILDSCHAGIVGDNPIAAGVAEIADGVTILTASTAEQYALEAPGGGAGVFTSLFVDALNGSAANLVGEITPGSVYAHIDQSLGPWAQRPVFKTNVKTFVSLRQADAPIDLGRVAGAGSALPHTGTRLQARSELRARACPWGKRQLTAARPRQHRRFQNAPKLRTRQPCSSERCTSHVARSYAVGIVRAYRAGSALLEVGKGRVDLMQRDVQAALSSNALLEVLAAVEHERWAHWQRYVHSRCARSEDGSLVIPAELVERWTAQVSTPYAELSEPEKESDREQVRKYLPLIASALS